MRKVLVVKGEEVGSRKRNRIETRQGENGEPSKSEGGGKEVLHIRCQHISSRGKVGLGKMKEEVFQNKNLKMDLTKSEC